MPIIDCVVSNVIFATGLAAVAVCVGRTSARPQIRHVLWLLVLVKLMTPPLVHIPVSYTVSEWFEAGASDNACSVATVGQPAVIAEDTFGYEGQTPVDVHRSPDQVSIAASVALPTATQDADQLANAVATPGVPWLKLVIGVWAGGSLMWFLLAGARLLRFRNVLRYAQPVAEHVQAEVQAIARKYGLRRLPRVLSVDANVPPLICACGRRTCIVLPSRLLAGLGTDERLGLLAHELAHLRRRDHWIRWLEFVVLGVYWWNPVAWWARTHVQQAEEECCDAWVLWAFPGKACLYAQTLLDTVDFLAGATQVKPEIATAFDQGYSLKRRIEMIVSEHVCRRLSWKMRTALVLFAVIFAPISLLGSQSEEAEKKPAPQPSETITQETQAAPGTKEEQLTLQGRVVGPDGKPFEGAKLYMQTAFDSNVRRDSPARATSGSDGTFRFDVARSEFNALWGDRALRFAPVIASAEGYGPDWGNGLEKDGATLRLVEEGTPIEGRIVDSEGRPVRDVNVNVIQIKAPEQENLSAWVDALKTAKEARSLENRFFRKSASTSLLGGILPPRKTKADGTFVLKGAGAERMATLRIEGPTIETSIINVVTRPLDRVELPDYRDAPSLGKTIYYGAAFEHRTRTAKPIVGVVRDKDSGKPLAGVQLRGEPALGGSTLMQWVTTTSDAQGRYRLTGLPRRARTHILAIPPDDQPYMLSRLKVKDEPESHETTLDFAMKRGIWIEGRVIDSATKEPVKGAAVFYYAFSDNPHAKDAPGLSGASRGWIVSYYVTPDGSFRRVGLPGRGLIAVRVTGSDRYQFGLGAGEIEGGKAMQGSVLFPTFPSMCNSGNYNAVVEVNPTENQDRHECNVVLDSGKTITGEVLDPDGQPLAGVLVWGGDDFGGPWAHEPLSGSTFRVEAYNPGKPRHMFFLHKERRLAGKVTVQGENPGKLTVQLQPWAILSGRLLDAEGNPKGGLEIHSWPSRKQDPTAGAPINGGPLPPTDKYTSNRLYAGDDGRFLIEGLVPGVNYNVGTVDPGSKTYAQILEDTVLKPGEVKAVGDVRLRKMPAEEEGEGKD